MTWWPRAGRALRKRPEVWLAIAAMVPFVVMILRGRMFFLLDILAEHYPNQAMLNAVLAESPRSSPLWNPYMFCGSPLLADPQMQVCYPPAILFRLLAYPAAFGWFVALHIALAVGGAAALLRTQRIGWAAAALGAAAYGLSGQMFISAVTPVCLAAMAWLPWTGWAAVGVARHPGARSAAGLGLVLAWMGLAGHPQFMLYAAGLIVAFWMAEGPTRRSAGWMVGGGVLAFGLIAIQVLPTLAYIPLTGRHAPLSAVQSGVDALQWRHLASYVFPLSAGTLPLNGTLDIRHLWPTFNFIGTLPLALACVGAWRGRSTRAVRFAIVLALTATALALGEHVPGIGSWIRDIPLLGWFRRSAYWMCLANLALAWLGALALDRHLASGKSQPARQKLAAGVAVLTWIELVAVGLTLQPAIPAGWIMTPAPVEHWLEAHLGPGQRWGRVLHGGSRVRQGIVEGSSIQDSAARVRGAFRPNLPAAAGLRQVDGVNPLFPKRVLQARTTVDRGDAPARTALLNRLGVVYEVAQARLPPPHSPVYAADVFVYERLGALPPVRIVGDGEGVIEDVVTAPGCWSFAVTGKHPMDVVIAESWLGGWQATIDGMRAPATLPDADGFITVAMGPGRHRVGARYESSAAHAGLLISVMTLAALLVAASRFRRSGAR